MRDLRPLALAALGLATVLASCGGGGLEVADLAGRWRGTSTWRAAEPGGNCYVEEVRSALPDAQPIELQLSVTDRDRGSMDGLLLLGEASSAWFFHGTLTGESLVLDGFELDCFSDRCLAPTTPVEVCLTAWRVVLDAGPSRLEGSSRLDLTLSLDGAAPFPGTLTGDWRLTR